MVKTELAKPIPNHNMIENQLIIPDWFKNNVQICFEWSPSAGFLDDHNQCAQHQRGLPRKLCSKVGYFTREYLDETDARPGGCYYR